MWLDKLGVAARLEHKVVVRQTFYGGFYSLINFDTLDPLPDYWSTFLYKKLVGSRVLEVRDGISLGRKTRVYAHCTSERSGYETGSLVLIALNTQHNEVQLVLTDGLEKLSVEQYLLTPGESNNLTSQTVKLNGKLIQMVNDTFLPDLQPKPLIPTESIILPPVSYGFFVVPNAQVEACQSPFKKQSGTSKTFVKV
jgi:heparanase 1